ncbi:MAG: signal peptide peptidase SppA [Pseudobacteriovorax sp.]|nr:signal peptide peptidase SppA [Pseudobacteriovorax sp.]
MILNTMKNLWKVFEYGSKAFIYTFVLILLVALIAVPLSKDKIAIEDGSYLVLNPKGAIVEQLDHKSPFDSLGSQMGSDQDSQTLLSDIVESIERAKDDERITGIYIDPRKMTAASLTQLQVIRTAMEQFKASGKATVSYAGALSQSQYYLASLADDVMINPFGAVVLEGYGRFRLYMKDMLDKLGVNFHIFKVGTFKSAIEPFIRNTMSDEAKLANKEYLDDIWARFREDISSARKIEAQAVDSYIESMVELSKENKGDLAQIALNAGLVDKVIDRVAFRNLMIEKTGKNEKGDNFKYITLNQYAKATNTPRIPNDKPKIAVITAKGTIVDGNQKEGQIGGDTFAQIIRRARNHENVKAIVMRVDSPGGSAYASEVIRQELLATQAAGKPVVISMGTLAASGGYWIAADADKIIAMDTTITGSIGIFGMFPTLEKPFAELGLTKDGVGSHWITGSMEIGLPMKEEVSQIIQLSVEKGYDRFLDVVSHGRDMDRNAVDKIAQGRVWSGKKALEIGLVDDIGDLDAAILSAAQLAKLTDYESIPFQRERSKKEQLVEQIMNSASAKWFAEFVTSDEQKLYSRLLSKIASKLEILTQFNDPKHVYAHCFCDID